MFKKKKIKKNAKSTQIKNAKKWKTMVIPKDKEMKKSSRIVRYAEAINGEKVFIEKLKNYNLYIISTGTNPGKVKVNNMAENLKSALLLANNQLAEIKNSIEK